MSGKRKATGKLNKKTTLTEWEERGVGWPGEGGAGQLINQLIRYSLSETVCYNNRIASYFIPI